MHPYTMTMQDVIDNGGEKQIELILHWGKKDYSAVKIALLVLIEHNPSADQKFQMVSL